MDFNNIKNSTLEMQALCGFVIYSKTTEELTKEGHIAPCEVKLLEFLHERETIEMQEESDTYAEEYMIQIAENNKRNEVIQQVCKYYSEKRQLILVSRVNHGDILQSLIPQSRFIAGKTSAEERKEIFDSFARGETKILIGMVQIMSTGINLPTLDVIINASANKSDVTTIQSIGRVLRKSEGKEKGIYIDIFDRNGLCVKASIQRKKALLSHGYTVKSVQISNF